MIDEIVRAISEKKKIEFKYFDYDSSHKKVYRKDGAVYKTERNFTFIFHSEKQSRNKCGCFSE